MNLSATLVAERLQPGDGKLAARVLLLTKVEWAIVNSASVCRAK